MKNENEDRLHEMLCAYVLAEGTEAERAEVERELAGSAELRAERETIEATIGLVRGAIGGAEAIAPGAAEVILARAAAPRPRPWHSHAPVRLAAGIAVLLGGVGVWALRSQPSSTRTDELAACEEPGGLRESITDRRAQRADDQVAMASKNEKRDAPMLADASSTERKLQEADSTIARDENGFFKQEAKALSGLGYSAESDEVIDRVDALVGRNTETIVPEPFQGGAGGVARRTTIGTRAGGTAGYKENVAVTPATEAPMSTDSLASGPASAGPGTPGTGKPSPFGGRKIGSAVGKGRAGGPTRVGSAAEGVLPPPSEGGAASAASTSVPFAPANDQGAYEKLKGLGYVGELSKEEHARMSSLGYFGADGDHGSDFYLGKGMRADNSGRLTPEQREQYLDEECRRIISSCYRRPNERPRDMFFRFWGDNPFEIAALDAQSTFSVDVDTASYALARRYLNEGNLPTKAQVRTEEFVNYFRADVTAPSECTFAVHTDLAPSRFSADASRSMLRVVVRGREVAKTERKPLALTFVIDVSGSMREQNRLEMVKHILRLLLAQLDANDSIAVVAFSDEARMILPMTSAGNRGLIESALFPLQPGGSTNSHGGLKMGYEAALAGINPNATNRVVFLSDGVANVGVTSANEITNEVQRIREKGIYLNTIGVGMNNHNDVLLEQLADKGDGVCNYVDSPEEAKRVMVDGFTGAFEPIARDVKIQVEFDPVQVARYRLLGYENRAVADKDFRNDKVDAGEIGAGHQVTALYEIERTGAAPAEEKPLAVVRLRWKAPRVAGTSANAETEQSTELEKPVLASQATSFEGAGAGYRRAVIVAQFAEILRRSEHARGESLDDLIGEATKLEREGQDAEFTELVLLMQKSRALILARQPVCDDLCQTVDLIRRNQLLRAERELLAQEQDSKLVEDIERQNRELEARIRELLRRRIESK